MVKENEKIIVSVRCTPALGILCLPPCLVVSDVVASVRRHPAVRCDVVEGSGKMEVGVVDRE